MKRLPVMPPWLRRFVLGATLLCAAAGASPGIIHLDTGDPSFYTSTPGDNSGWQYEGLFNGFLGTPIAPNYFLTAKHIGGTVGDSFIFHGATYTTTAVFPDSETDLQIWQVSQTFATYAPIYQPVNTDPSGPQDGSVSNTEVSQELRVFGRGTQRGGEIDFGGTPRGWAWGNGDGVERWGRNVVAATQPSGSQDWTFLQVAFQSPGPPGEAHLSVGDSGGGLFILQNGLWRLAGINYAVDDLFTKPDPSTAFVAAIFDARGYYTENDDGTFTLLGGAANAPTNFYCTQVSTRLKAWIETTVGDLSTLPAENYAAWQHAYFTPDQIADPTVSGPNADPDGDGVANLLEFAFNLDPTFPEPVVMTADTGLRGLPLIRVEQISASDRRLTAEYVRRTSGSGAGLTYQTQFSSSPSTGWQAGGTESVTAINERWERVKVTGTVSLDGTVPARFARVLVSQH